MPLMFEEMIDRREVPAVKVHPRIIGDVSTEGAANVFAAGVADMDFRPPQAVIEALQNRLDHGVFGYEFEADGLKPSLVTWLDERHGWAIGEEDILDMPNVSNGLAASIRLFSEPGDGVIVQPPVFFEVHNLIEANDRVMVRNPLILNQGRYEMDLELLESQASDPATRLLFLCQPHNPVGRVWRREELLRLGEICLRHNVLVIADEIHGDLAFPGHAFIPFASLNEDFSANCITLISPAKTFNIPACCSAFAIIMEETKRRRFLQDSDRLIANKNNAFEAVAMEAAYRGGGEWLDAAIAHFEANVALVRQRLADVPWVDLIEPEGTFLIWLDFRKTGLRGDDLDGFLRNDAGWVVSRGHAFGIEGEGFARVNIATPSKALETALDRLVPVLTQNFA